MKVYEQSNSNTAVSLKITCQFCQDIVQAEHNNDYNNFTDAAHRIEFHNNSMNNSIIMMLSV